MVREYLAQLETLAIIAFLLWRVETLQELNAKETVMPEDIPDVEENDESTASIMTMAIPDNIQELLDKHCVRTRLYLQHDLTLQQLATAIGTNRTYLSAYFTQQGITYNTYINRLRIDHFMRLYRESIKSERTVTAIQLAQKSGFRSYSTFAAAFKFFNGLTVTAWTKMPM
jgi:AraC-like DNA-binding protein